MIVNVTNIFPVRVTQTLNIKIISLSKLDENIKKKYYIKKMIELSSRAHNNSHLGV